jgi:hypothetical protein
MYDRISLEERAFNVTRKLRSPFRLSSRLIACLAIVAGMKSAAAQDVQQLPRVHFNQTSIEEARQPFPLSLADHMAVFALVFRNLPDRVQVYPTENYYYFSFVANGRPIQGNIRLDPRYRDEGKIFFAYFDNPSLWNASPALEHVHLLDAASGVSVERVAALSYRVTYRGREVLFALNDLASVKPPPGVMSAEERYLGPVFDESAVRFFLVYNPKARVFHYILDETENAADVLLQLPGAERVLIGQRTGFAFYTDHHRPRKILIGVHNSNVALNNYFDGPADQLPENFVEGDDLRSAILHADAGASDKIDRLGYYTGTKLRYVIDPYIYYSKVSDLLRLHRCATGKKHKSAEYLKCFALPKQ